MAKEIEKKFLVSGDGWKKMPLLKKVNIEQGYLQKTRTGQTIRVRVTDDQAFLTIKGPTKGITRDEYEYEIPHGDGEQLIKMSVTPTVKKIRHYLRDDKNQLWEIDTFRGINRGLTIAEIELQNEKQVVGLPSWVGADVSEDKRYFNSYLAENKVPRK